MTKFRLSNHNLMIEKGRHRNLDRTMRICLFCTAVEDEIHFLTKCETFRHLRSSLLHNVEQKLNIRNLKYMEGRSLLKLLLEKEEIAQLVAKYLTKSFELREFLAANPRQFMWWGEGLLFSLFHGYFYNYYFLLFLFCSVFFYIYTSKKNFSVNLTYITYL